LAHPKLVLEFDKLAKSIAPGFTPFEYRWAALNVRKKGSNEKISAEELNELEWSGHVPFASASLPNEEGVYGLFEREMCLFVAGTEGLDESIQSQKRIAEVPLFERAYWQPDPRRMSWQYAVMAGSDAERRFGVVRSLVRAWQPVFNIPRGSEHQSP
jgi:hypothetical protein